MLVNFSKEQEGEFRRKEELKECGLLNVFMKEHNHFLFEFLDQETLTRFKPVENQDLTS
jgi:hypothetical protein